MLIPSASVQYITISVSSDCNMFLSKYPEVVGMHDGAASTYIQYMIGRYTLFTTVIPIYIYREREREKEVEGWGVVRDGRTQSFAMAYMYMFLQSDLLIWPLFMVDSILISSNRRKNFIVSYAWS